MKKNFFLFLFFYLVQSQTGYTSFTCPTNWAYYSIDDTCNALFPKPDFEKVEGNDLLVSKPYDATEAKKKSFPLNYELATDLCAHYGAHLPIVKNAAKLTFYNNLIKTEDNKDSGRVYWIGVKRDPKLTARTEDNAKKFFYSLRGHPVDQGNDNDYYDWDTDRPARVEHDCVAMATKGTAKTIWGGNGKMITMDCGDVAHVICTKPRVPYNIGAINDGPPRPIFFVHNNNDAPNLVLDFAGSRIPEGTWVTLQTAEDNVRESTGSPTRCKNVKKIDTEGPTKAIELSILATDATNKPGGQANATFNKKFCGGPKCDWARATWTNWKGERGARYSICFFTPYPWKKSTFTKLTEYENELLGVNAYVEVVQHYHHYLEDVCAVRRQDIVGLSSNIYQEFPKFPLPPFVHRVEGDKDKKYRGVFGDKN